VVDIDPKRLYGWGLSPRDVTQAIANQNVILPTGPAQMGTNEYAGALDASPEAFAEIGALPMKDVRGTTVYVGDVANVRDGASPQTNMVHVGGKRSVLLSVLKNGNTSTMEIAARIKAMLPQIRARLPKDLSVNVMFDQSLFVR